MRAIGMVGSRSFEPWLAKARLSSLTLPVYVGDEGYKLHAAGLALFSYLSKNENMFLLPKVSLRMPALASMWTVDLYLPFYRDPNATTVL